MSTLRERVRHATRAAVMIIATACSTDTTAPTTLVPSDASAARGAAITSVAKSSGASLQSVQAVGRLRPLTQDVTVRQVIGPEGGSINLPSHGFTLVVPAGAVAAPTAFAVKALAGRTVAYEFEPHGITFKAPLTFRQSVVTTSLGWGQRVAGGYFPDRALINSTSGKAKVSEVLPAAVNGSFIEFHIWHFSGYLVSCA